METPAVNPPTLCFATVCKNEEACILATLEAVAPYISSWVVCDTGSTDRTCEIVEDFFRERGIPGRLYRDEWIGYDVNKTKMMERARLELIYDGAPADYVLHLDADDWLVPTAAGWDLTHVDQPKADCYYATLRRGSAAYRATVVYSNRLHWRFCGVAHTIIKCEKTQPIHGELRDCYIDAEARGVRALDPDKYKNDATKLVAQFESTLVHDPDGLNARSAFYAAQSYMDSGMYDEAIRWYRTYLRLKDTWIEEVFEAHTRIARCMMAKRQDPALVELEISRALEIEPDRAEPAFWFGMYCNQHSDHIRAYTYLSRARKQSLAAVHDKYLLFVSERCYGKHVNDELSVACYWTDRWEEGIQLAREIVDDPAFTAVRDRIQDNLAKLEDLKCQKTATAPRALVPDMFALGTQARQILVVDDFYADPDAVRRLAIGSEFGATPAYHKGQRTTDTYRPDHVREALEALLDKRITKWDYGTNGVFQFCTAEDQLVYHCDDQQYAAVVYLAPDAPPEAGSSFYRHRDTKRRSASQDPAVMKALFSRGFYDRTQFEVVDVVGNIYNRLVVWNARLIHAASAYFGQGLEDARLFQMFFFDAE
jgi:glycosyltransferase involved in cell wall biosynthesis